VGHEHHDADGHEEDRHEHVPLCASREEVRAILEGFLAAGSTGRPVVSRGGRRLAGGRSAGGTAAAVPVASGIHVPGWSHRAHPGLPG
jgi:hypothetical protein